MTVRRAARPHSLVNRLLIAQIAPLAVVATVLLGAGAWTAHRVVERTSDRLLAGSMDAIRETVTLKDGRVTVDVAPWSLALLDSPERDAVFYSVREGDRLVTGYAELPVLPAVGPERPVFANLTVLGVPVRMAQQSVEIPGGRAPVVVSVAQSLDSRQASVRELNRGLLLLLGLLVVLAALLVWPAIWWGLYSLRRLTRELSSRSGAGATDFAPVPVELAPRDLSPALSAFNSLLAGLERSTSGMRRFSADASHQLRTPLTVVAANLDLLAASPRRWSRADRRLLDDSRGAIASMARLISQLLSVARADAAATVGEADISRAARRAIGVARHPDTPASMIRFRLPTVPVTARGDESLIVEQIVNLIDNAQRHGAPPVFVWVSARADQVCVTVWDHGRGVDAADLPRLGERFYRGRSALPSPGSGLGLSIVASMAETQGGALRLRNRASRAGLVATLVYRAR